MPADLTPEQRREMRTRHQPHHLWPNRCKCGAQLLSNCDAARLLDALEESERRRTKGTTRGPTVADLSDAEKLETLRGMLTREVRRRQEAERQRDDALDALRDIASAGCDGGDCLKRFPEEPPCDSCVARQARERIERSET